jgi:hypothetical protein
MGDDPPPILGYEPREQKDRQSIRSGDVVVLVIAVLPFLILLLLLVAFSW